MTEAWKQWEGQVIHGEFHLRQYLGGSDHSAVFRTESGERRAQKAAIKFVPADPRNAELQLSRWRMAAKLSHPNLLRLFRMGRCQLDGAELLYLVMEYAEEDLSQILPTRPLTPTEARDMLQPTLQALRYLHGKDFVHGHLKPANILAIDDQLKLSSDGLRRIGESSGRSGKPSAYDPPEWASGGVSPAGDVWSLGMTLVEALTQRLPAWERAEPVDPTVPEGVPEPFSDLARHCLRRDPRRRWTVAEIAARLQPTTAVTQEQLPVRLRELAKRRYVLPIAAVSLVVAAVLVGPRLLDQRPRPPRTPSPATKQTAAQPKSERQPAVPETAPAPTSKSWSAPAIQSAREEKPSGAASSPASLRSEAAKAPAPTTASPSGPGSGNVRGEVVQEVVPDVPQKALDTIRGTVRVSVRLAVDPSGSVAEATLDSPGPSKYFADLALQAARRWEFWPARVDGRYVPSEWILRFEFTQGGTKAFPRQAAP